MVYGVKGKILVIEDERKISDIVRSYLERDGHTVLVADTGEKGISTLKDSPDLVVLDLMLPDISGEDICEAVRRDSDIPILMLTSKSEEEDKVRGLEIGADDYVVKPFSPREVVARVNALLRRTMKKRAVLSFNEGALLIDAESIKVFVDGEQVDLTSTEYKILVAFSKRPGNVFSRTQLVNIAQGYDFEGFDRTVDAHIKNLRHKIDPDPRSPRFVKTVYGMGYRFIGTPDED